MIRDEEESFYPHARPRHQALRGSGGTSARNAASNVISGEDAFMLHDTYGFSIDITEQMAAEAGLTVDRAGLRAATGAGQATRSRQGRKKFVVTAVQGELPKTDDSPKYDGLSAKGKVVGWVKDNAVVTLRPAARGRRGRAAARPHQLLRRAGRPGRRSRRRRHADRPFRGRGHAEARRRRAARRPASPRATSSRASRRRWKSAAPGRTPCATTPPRTCSTGRCARCWAAKSTKRDRWSMPRRRASTSRMTSRCQRKRSPRSSGWSTRRSTATCR